MFYLTQKRLEILRILAVARKYLEIFHLGQGESTVLLRTNWEMSLAYSLRDNLWSISEIVDGDRKVSHVSSS